MTNRAPASSDRLEIPDGYYRSVKFPGMVFRRRQIDVGVPAKPGSHVKIIADRTMAWLRSGRVAPVPMTASAAWYVRHRAGCGDHPARGETRYVGDEFGKLIVDEDDVTGFKTIAKPVEVPMDRTTTPEERAAGRGRARLKASMERRAIAKMRKKFEKRQSIGDPNCRPSENEDFPLLAVLRRDRRDNFIVAALAYRQLVALCESEPLTGQSYEASIGMEVERRSVLRDGVKEVDAAAAEGFKSGVVPGGEIEYRSEIKRSKGTYNLSARRILAAVAANDGDPIVGRTRSLHTKLNADTLTDYIDKKPVLTKIRAALGGLQDPLEDAVLGGRTMQAIGEAEGFSGSAAPSVGKGLVYRGLVILDGFLGAKKYRPANDNYLVERRKIA
jgi:hypothetical protein